jgi:hypothetical protein
VVTVSIKSVEKLHIVIAALLVLLLLLALLPGSQPARAQAPAPQTPLDREQILIYGLRLQPSPTHQVVPKNTVTAINAPLLTPDGQPASFAGSAQGAIVAQLRGPAFAAPIQVSGVPNQLLYLPPLPLAGLYVLENIRMVADGRVVLQGNPDAVTIEVIDRVLASQVTTRPLTAQEILDKGIFFDEDNFRAVNFTVAIGVQGQKIPVTFPMLLPRTPSRPSQRPAFVPRPPNGIGSPRPPDQPRMNLPGFNLTNLSVSGFSLECASLCDIQALRLVPPIPGVLIFPGNIAYLNQYFSALLLVSNVAPGYSNLVVDNVKAEIVLPAGKDTVAETSDDPLRMAELGTPPLPQSKIQPVAQPGADGKLGTADDIPTLAPGQDGNSEFLIEGRRQGIHTVDVKITATLNGLPGGPVQLQGRAVGVLEVRDPTFALTFNHPRTVSTGEEYDFFITVSNISDTPANFVSLNLLKRSISGAELLSDENVPVETILPGDSATAVFRLRSLQTGSVIATSLDSDVAGKFEFRLAVGELGIPLSPNTLQFPHEVNSLPPELRTTATALLGQAYALATAPFTPPGLLPMRKEIVYQRTIDLAVAGQRISLGEPLTAVLRDLALDFTGNQDFRSLEDFGSLEADEAAFDRLLRTSRRGAAFLDALTSLLLPAVQNSGPLAFQAEFADQVVSRSPHLSIITGGNNPAPVQLLLTDPLGNRLSASDDAIPNGAYFNFASVPSEMALLSTPQNGLHVLELTGVASGIFDLGVVVPDENGLRRLTYPQVNMTAGGRARLLLDVGGVNDFILWLDLDGDGQFETQVAPTLNEPVAEAGPQVISAWEMGSLDSFGRIMAVLFDEEVSPTSAQSGALGDAITHYAVEANQPLGVALQPSGRVALLRLRDGLGPFIQRSTTISEVADIHGNLMTPISVTVPISPTACNSGLIRCGGTVSGQVRKADGTPVPFAEIVFQQKIPVFDVIKWETITRKQADADGRYSFDFVSSWPSSFAGSDPASGASGKVLTQIRYAGQHLDVDIILPGTGTLVGRVLAADGVTPLPNAEIGVESLNRFGARFAATSDANGVFAIGGVPVGPLSIVAVHRPTASQIVAAGLIERDGEVVTQDLVLFPVNRPGLPPPGNVVGRVLRSDGVTPVAGVPVFTDKGGVTTSDDEGRYRIDGLQPGAVKVQSFDEQLFETASVNTTILSGKDVTANLLLFGGSGTVTGSVIDAAGQPVAGAQIYGGWQVITTGADGQFTLPDMPLGERDLAALIPNTQISVRLKVNLTQPGESVAVQFRLPAYGVITGRVTLADGVTPAANVDVILLGRDGGGSYMTETDASGAYRVESALAGIYKISSFLPSFSDANVIETRLVAHRQTVRADMRYRGKGRVIVRMFDDDGVTPIAGQLLLSEFQVLKDQLTPSDNPECLPDITIGDVVIKMTPCKTIVSGFALIPTTRSGQTDAATGEATFDNVIVGDVRVQGANAFNGGSQGSGALPAPGATEIISLTLKGTSEVSGTVYQPDGVTPVGEDVTVEFNGRLKNVTVVTNENGQYWFPLVNAGDFSVTAEDPASGLSGQSRGSVDAGRGAVVNIRLLGKGSAAVQVVGTSGAPIANAPLQLVRTGFPAQTLAGLTGANGWFTFTYNVTEGSFSVRATNPGNGAKGSRSGRITAPGGFATVRITILDEAGVVNGRFVLPDGTPAVNAQIELRSNFEGREDFTSTDATGAFIFEGVPKAGFSLTGYDFATNRTGKASGAITTDGQTVTVTITAQALGSVVGLVTAASDGSPVAAAEVTLKSAAFEMVTTSGLNGGYSFPSVPAGSFNLTANASGATGKASGSLVNESQVVTANIVVAVPPPTPVGRVEGSVRGADGEIVPGAQVSLSYGKTQRNTTVDDDGFYFFDGVPLVSFTLLAKSPIPPDAGATTGSLGYDGEVLQIDLQLLGTGTINGVVLSGGGAPVGFAEVKLTRQGQSPIPYKAQTFADANGHFTFTKVLAGNLSLSAKQPATNLGGSTSTALAAGETANVTITLQAAGSISGRVLRQDGVTPAQNMTLDLQSSGNKHRYDLTDASGFFTFTEIALGSYTLLVNDALGEGTASSGATLSSQGELLDLGDIVLDEANPRVVAITPTDGSQNIPVTQTITIDFSEPVKANTVNNSTILVTSGATQIAGSFGLDTSGTRAIFTPTLPLPSFGQVTVKVKIGVTDLVGKPLSAESVASFTTRDIIPPAIVSLSPAPDATNVALESVVRVTFGEPVDLGQFAVPVISLSRNGAGVSGQIAWINANTVAIFTPDSPLLANQSYSVTVQPASDLSGNQQPDATSYTFDSLDVQIPLITALIAQPGTTLLEGQSATVEASVDAPDVAFVEFFVNGQLVRTDTAAPFGFVYQAPTNGSQAVTVAARATDNAGNVSPDVTLALNVQSDLPPVVTILGPADGAGVSAGGKLTVTAQVQDDVGVAQVVVQTTGAMTTSRAATVAPAAQDKVVTLVLDVAPAAPFGGAITVKAGAVDTRGQSGASPALTVFVTGDAAKPSAQIASPANNSLVAPGAVVSVVVNASDNHGLTSVSLNASGAATLAETHFISPTQTAVSATFSLTIPANAAANQIVTVIAQAQDASGNLSLMAQITLKIADVVAPVVTVQASGGVTHVVQGDTVDLTVSASDNLNINRLGYRTSGALVASGSKAVSPPKTTTTSDFTLSIPAATAPGGVIVVTGVATDTTSNVGASAQLSLTVLADAPPVVSITSPITGSAVAVGQLLTITVAVQDDLGVTQVRLDSSGALTTTQTISVSPAKRSHSAQFVLNIPANIAPGTPLILTAQASDTRGQVSAPTVAVISVGDLTPPLVSFVSPANNAAVQPGSVVNVVIVASDPSLVAQVEMAASGVLTLTQSSVISPVRSPVTVTLPITIPVAPANALITVQSRAIDALGNVSPFAMLTLRMADVTPPVVTLTSSASTVVPGNSITLTVSANDDVELTGVGYAATGAIVTSVDHPVTGAPTVTSTHFVLTAPPTLNTGDVITVTGAATDTTGNHGASLPLMIAVLEDQPPQVAIVSPADGAVVGIGQNAVISVQTADDVGVAQVRLASSGAVTATLDAPVTPAQKNSAVQFALPIPVDALLGGVIQLQIDAVDTRGQSSGMAVLTLLVADLTPPSVQIVSPPPDSLVDPGQAVSVFVTAQDNLAVAEVALATSGALSTSETRSIQPPATPVTATFVITVPAAATGNDVIVLTTQSADPSANASQPVSITLQVRDVVAPQVNMTVTPAFTQVVRGGSVTITVNASDEVALGSISFTANGVVNAADSRPVDPPATTGSASFILNTPPTATVGSTISLTGNASDASNNDGVSSPLILTLVEPGARVVGVVTNVQHQAVAGALVTVTAVNGVFGATTDTNGRYTVGVAQPGPVTVQVVDPATSQNGRVDSVVGAYDVQVTVDVQVSGLPLVTITSPAANAVLVRGETIPFSASASDDLGVVSVEFWVNGGLLFVDESAPYGLNYLVPADAAVLTFSAFANDVEGNRVQAVDVLASAVDDPLTTVSGQAVNTLGAPVAGALVKVIYTASNTQHPVTTTTNISGFFSLTGISTIAGLVRTDITGDVAGTAVKGSSTAVQPVRGGVTNLGVVLLRANVCWDGGGNGTSWHDTANWCQDTLPGPIDDVVISVAANPTIVHSQGDDTIQSLLSDEAFTLNGGSLRVAGTAQVNGSFNLQGGALISATVQPGSGGQGVTVLGTASVMAGVTMNANLSLAVNGQNVALKVRDGLTLNSTATLGRSGDCETGRLDFDGTQTLGGAGTVLFVDRHNTACNDSRFTGLRVVTAGTTLTIGPNITVRGGEGFIGYSDQIAGSTSDVGVVLQGTVLANIGDAEMRIQGQHWRNEGGRIVASAGGVYINGASIDNSGQTLSVTGGGFIRFNGSAIVGGVVSGTTSSRLTFINGNTLDGVDLTSLNLTLGQNGVASSWVTVRNGLTLNGTATLGISGDCEWGRFDFDGSQTLSGAGTVVFVDRHNTSCNDSRDAGLRVVTAGTTLTIGPNITVRGGEGFIGYSDQIAGSTSDVGVVFQGTLKSDIGDAEVLLQGQRWRNEGGHIVASVGGVYITGANIDNSGQLLDITGSAFIRLNNSAIVGGVVSGTTSSRLTFINGNTLDGVDLTSLNLTLGQNGVASSWVTVRNGLTLNGAATLGISGDCEWGRFDFDGTQALSGAGTVVFVDRHNTSCNDPDDAGLRVATAGTTLTIGPNITVRGGEGFIGYSSEIGGSSDVSVVFQGTLKSDIGDAEVLLQGQHWRNEGGRIVASAGGVYINGASIDNSGQLLDITGSAFIRLNNSAIVGGVVSGTTSSRLTFINSNTLDGVDLTSLNLTLGQNGVASSWVTVRNGLTLNGAATLGISGDCEWGRFDFDGSQTLSGAGTVVFVDRHNTSCNDPDDAGLRVATAGTTLTIGPNITVRGGEGFIGYSSEIGGSSDVGVVFQGTLKSDIGDAEMLLQGQHWRNEGGRIVASVGGVYITGASIDNSGQLLDVTGSAFIRFNNSAIVGGVVSGTTASRLTFINSNTLDGVDLTSLNLTLGQNGVASSWVAVRNGLTLNGTATLGISGDCEWGRFDFDGTQALSGAGTVVFVDRHNTSCNDSRDIGLRVVTAGTTLTIGPNIRVSGGEGFVGYSSKIGGSEAFVLVNQGRITASGSGSEVIVRGATLVNDGVIEMSSAGFVTAQGALTNNGLLDTGAANPGTLSLTGSYTQALTGQLRVDIRGTAAGTQFGRLVVSGKALLDGVLNATRSTNYLPTVGATFRVVSSASRAGEFSGVIGTEIDETRHFSPTYDASGSLLRVLAGPAAAPGPTPTLGAAQPIDCQGALVATANAADATNQFFTNLLRVNGEPFPCLDGVNVAAQEQQLAFGPVTLSGVQVTRKVYAPADGRLVRSLELLTNAGDTAQVITVTVEGYLASGAATRLVIDPLAQTTGYAVVDGDLFGPAQLPVLAQVFAGMGASAPPVVEFSNGSGEFAYRWLNLTLQPGQTVALLHFVAQAAAGDTAGAIAHAEALSRLEDVASLVQISTEERAWVINFAMTQEEVTPVIAPETPHESDAPGRIFLPVIMGAEANLQTAPSAANEAAPPPEAGEERVYLPLVGR